MGWYVDLVKTIALWILSIFCVLCIIALIMTSDNTFFGAKMTGPRVLRANGGIECATVRVDDKEVCKCHVVTDSLAHDKTYLTSENKDWCNPDLKFPND